MTLRVDEQAGRITGTPREVANLEEAVARAEQGASYPLPFPGPYHALGGRRFDPPIEWDDLTPEQQQTVPKQVRAKLRDRRRRGTVPLTERLRALDGQQVQLRDGRSYTIRTREAQVVTRG